MAKFPAKDAQAAAQSDALDKLRVSLEAWKKLGNNAGCAEATLVQGQIFALFNNETTSVQKIKIGIGAHITGFTSTKVPILTRDA